MANMLKKSMVYLGLAEEADNYETPSAPAEREWRDDASYANEPTGTVTPLRRPTAVRESAATAVNEILTVHPKQYKDAQIIAEGFREGLPVIINLSQMSDGEGRRLIDFASGLAMGLYGKIERVTSKVFLLSPESVVISGHSDVPAVAAADVAGFADH